ncbi:MAG: hypothetical protein K0R48_130 [Gammaproteobacteria bacterium]|jgi:type II secretory pathway pseudopilin PulG|nr:hypothetical protein [Gammaproteobacteria bacterium]
MRLKSQGVTLLEVMLATALILLALVIGTVQYKKMVLRQNATEIQNSVIFLGNALQQYYNVNCYWFLTDPASYGDPYSISLNTNPSVVPAPSSNTEPNPTLIDYIPNPASINNPYAVQSGLNAYTYQIDTRADFPVLTISTQFSPSLSPSLFSFLQGRLKPSSVDVAHKTFTWNIVRNQPVKRRFNGLNANLSYVNAMAGNLYLDIGGGQYGMQYYNSGVQFTNVCSYWQIPQNRCQRTEVESRCTYQSSSP